MNDREMNFFVESIYNLISKKKGDKKADKERNSN